MQGNEGNIDPVHLSFLHQYLSEAQVARQRIVKGSNVTDNTLLADDITPTIEVEVTDFGLRIYTLRDAGADKRYLRVTNFVMPNLSAFGGSTVGDGYAVHWHVPIDDTHHWKYLFMFSRTKPLDPELRNKNRSELTADSQARGSHRQEDRHRGFRRCQRTGDSAGAQRMECRGQSVTIMQAGGAPQRLIAMTAKALDATVLAQPELGEAPRAWA